MLLALIHIFVSTTVSSDGSPPWSCDEEGFEEEEEEEEEEENDDESPPKRLRRP